MGISPNNRRPRLSDAEYAFYCKVKDIFGSWKCAWEEYTKKVEGAQQLTTKEQTYLDKILKAFGSLEEAWKEYKEGLLKKDVQLAKNRAELTRLKSQNQQLIKENINLSKVIDTQAALKEDTATKKVKFVPNKKDSSESTGILLLSDWHVEETVEAETVNGLNANNPAISEKRIEKIAPKTLQYIEAQRAITNIDNLIVAILGDLLSGYIHEELEETNSMTPTETVVWLQQRIEGLLDYLLEHGKFKHIHVICKVGNHGRITKLYRHKTGVKNNYEYLLYKFLDLHYQRNERISFQIDHSYSTYQEVYGYRLRFHHGHYIKYNGGILGLNVPVEKWIASTNSKIAADYDFFGHYHRSLFGGNWLSNGSLIGTGEYGMSIKSHHEAPQQILAYVEKTRGLTNFCRIFVD